MAKKPLLDATSKPKSAFGDWTAGYRQSKNVIDERAQQYQRTETPDDANAYGDLPSGWNGASTAKTGRARSDTTNARSTEGAADSEDYAVGPSGNRTNTASGSTTRKVSAEEAIRRTYTER